MQTTNKNRRLSAERRKAASHNHQTAWTLFVTLIGAILAILHIHSNQSSSPIDRERSPAAYESFGAQPIPGIPRLSESDELAIRSMAKVQEDRLGIRKIIR